ncbi:hypothetical protein SAMN05421747_10252 [Parapedobacter composti]|uniref:Lysylphosphatidylglycerol synthase TM region n=1 Tax=Parapedobacter composti TaxID=623281 RepID=A0A1I1EVE3_9SPHI|nr:lysylphosphatidylglycerol synthase transmembrane domain-containing protein [Parapedobacter composti]SFB91139.1 hypothetical protein SAMN05421747_10252 [Parapedobacter composti]
MAQKRTWRILKTALQICVTAGALYWVFRTSEINPNDIKEALIKANPAFLAAAFIAYGGYAVFASLRLNGFFKGIGLQLSERYNFKLFLLGLFYNLFLPGGIGGDGYKIYFLRRKFKIKGRKVLSAVFFDRLSGLWALCLITSALVIFIPRLQVPNEVPILLVIVGTIAYYATIRRYFPDYTQRFFSTHAKALAAQSMQVICAICLLYALQYDGKFSPYLFMFLLSSLVAVVPFTVSGLGLREIVNVAGAQYFHMDERLALLISLLFYVVSAALAASGAYFIFRPQGLGTDKLPTSEEVETANEDERD